ncbi:MAG: dephospho-CoA kinase [Cyanobacteria bacterium P01_C01_bin.89]
MGLVIGVTGGIGTGKTTVTDFLHQRYDCKVLDADVLAREAVAPGSEGLDAIARRYGLTMLRPDGTLDRSRLGRLVFDQPRERKWLEQLIHPWVRNALEAGMKTWRDSTVPNAPPLILAIPLLFEAKLEYLVDEIWVVACDEAVQRQRIMERDSLEIADAQRRIDAQMPLAQKCDRANVVIQNNDSLPTLRHSVDITYQRLRLIDQKR